MKPMQRISGDGKVMRNRKKQITKWKVLGSKYILDLRRQSYVEFVILKVKCSGAH
jgi:hypothetical protein